MTAMERDDGIEDVLIGETRLIGQKLVEEEGDEVNVVFGGVGIGATSPLQGIHGAAIFPDDRLGEGMGTLSLVFGAAMAAGPVAVSVAAGGDDVRWLGPIVAVVGAVLAVTMMRSPAYPDR